MTETFKQYFFKKLIIWGVIGILALVIRYLSQPDTSFLFATLIILGALAIGLLRGYLDYRFYEKVAPKVETELLETTPLSKFQSIGFSKEDDNKISGFINNYKIFLAPITNIDGDKWLTILIPVENDTKIGAHSKADNSPFQFRLTDNVLFAEAILKNFDTVYDFQKLLALLEKTTLNLSNTGILPIKITDE